MRSPRALGLSARMQLRLRSDWPLYCSALSGALVAGGQDGAVYDGHGRLCARGLRDHLSSSHVRSVVVSSSVLCAVVLYVLHLQRRLSVSFWILEYVGSVLDFLG